MVQAAEQTQDVDIVIAIAFETAIFIVCVRWPRTAIENGWSYVKDVVDAETASWLKKAEEEIINESGKWQPTGTITTSTAYVAPGASSKIKATVSTLLKTAKVDAGTEIILKNFLGNIETRADWYEPYFNGVLFAGQGCIVQWDDTKGFHVSLHEYIAVGDKAYAPINILNILFELEKEDPSLFMTVRGCMSAIRYCLESLYECGDVGVTLFLQRKRQEKDNWENFKVWEKRMGDKSWRIFKVQDKGEKDSKRAGVRDWDDEDAEDEDMFEEEEEEEEEEEGEMLIEALQRMAI